MVLEGNDGSTHLRHCAVEFSMALSEMGAGLRSFSAESSRGWVSFKDGSWEECDIKNSDDQSLTLQLKDGAVKTFPKKQVLNFPVCVLPQPK